MVTQVSSVSRISWWVMAACFTAGCGAPDPTPVPNELSHPRLITSSYASQLTTRTQGAEASRGVDLAVASSVAYQIDPAHTGSLPNGTLRLPLSKRWTHDFGGDVSFPLVANGKVFVVVGNHAQGSTQPVFEHAVFALDARTGRTIWGPFEIGGSYGWAAAAYDDGKVFAVNYDGQLWAIDAATGGVLWQKPMPGQYSFTSAPTAFGGMVFVGGAGSGGTVYGVSQIDGAVRWTARVENGDQSSPAVNARGVFVSYACNQAYEFAPAHGTLLWHHDSSCEGGGGKTVALLDDLIYTREVGEGGLVLSADTGSQTGAHASTFIPAGSRGTVYFTVNGGLVASRGGGPTQIWSFTPGAGERIITAPIIIGSHVVVGSDKRLYVLDADEGKVDSSDELLDIRSPDEQNAVGPLAGFGAGGGMLFVPAGTALVAY